MIEFIGFLLLVLAIAVIALLASIGVGYFVRTYLLPTPENESLPDYWVKRFSARGRFDKAYDARRNALLESERRRRAESGDR